MGTHFRTFGIILFFLLPLACGLEDKGFSKLQVAEDLSLGTKLDDVKTDWFLYSTKTLQLDQTMSNDSDLVYRGVSRDPSVTGFYFYFNVRTKILEHLEWCFHSSRTDSKEKELLEKWTQKLGPPSFEQHWGNRGYLWKDRKARLELYFSEGVCHLDHRLN
jgi:hypothetical protein